MRFTTGDMEILREFQLCFFMVGLEAESTKITIVILIQKSITSYFLTKEGVGKADPFQN